jgi:uncharacterized membrane protein
VHPAASEAVALWSRYLVDWTRWNHVRTITSLLAATLLTVGVYLGARGPTGG